MEVAGDLTGIDHQVFLGVLDVDLIHIGEGELVTHHVQTQARSRGDVGAALWIEEWCTEGVFIVLVTLH